MNALRKSATDILEEQLFKEAPSVYNTVHITTDGGPDSKPKFSQNDCTLAQIEDRATQAAPSVLLVKVLYERPDVTHTFHTSQYDMVKLCGVLHIEHYAMAMVAANVTGFHCLGGDSYYLNCAGYQLAWSYHRSTQTTRAIGFIYNSARGREAFDDYVEVLEVTLNFFHSPTFLLLAGALQVMRFADKVLRKQYNACQSTETATGFHPWQASSAGKEMGELSAMSRDMSALVVEVEMMIRLTKAWKLATEACRRLQDEYHGERNLSREVGSNDAASATDASAALEIIQSRLEVMVLDFEYVRARAKNQLTAVSACPWAPQSPGMAIY